MNVFNSLGSNFTLRSAFGALIARAGRDEPEKLEEFLAKRYGGTAYLFYKGREALFAALVAAGLPPKSGICITGYICYAVYQAVTAAGMTPVFVDIGKDDVNVTAAGLETVLKNHPDVRAVILQNTYGFPQDIRGIGKIAKKYGLIVIEDLAHSVGAVYGDGRTAGSAGDFAALSFSQDKMIDAVSGGALVVRTKPNLRPELRKRAAVGAGQMIRDRWYPTLASIIRMTYPIPGKFIHAALRNLGLLSSPMGDTTGITLHTLPPWYARQVINAFRYLRDDIVHRRMIASIYASAIKPVCLVPAIVPLIPRAAPLRFPIIVRNRDGLIAEAKRHGLFISDIWYDAPVAPKKYFFKTTYAGECPNAEALSESVVNLPTHKNISSRDAKIISDIINRWHA